MKQFFKKVWNVLTEPDDYDGLTWFDVILFSVLSGIIFTGLALLIK